VHETLKGSEHRARTLIRLARELDKGGAAGHPGRSGSGVGECGAAQAIAEAVAQLPVGETVQIHPETIEILHVRDDPDTTVKAALVAWRAAGSPRASPDLKTEEDLSGEAAGDDADEADASPWVGVDASGRVWVVGQTSLLRQAAEVQLVSMARWYTPERLRAAIKHLPAVTAPHLAEERDRKHAERAEREMQRDRYLTLTPPSPKAAGCCEACSAVRTPR